MKLHPQIKIYNSYGNDGRILVMGHVFLSKQEPQEVTPKIKNNLLALLQLFRKQTMPNARLRLDFLDQTHFTHSELDGFFKFDFATTAPMSSGWQTINVAILDEDETVISTAEGEFYLPTQTKYAFISDIDDTIMKSFSATIFKRLYELISRSPAKRRLFDNTSKFYNALAESNTVDGFKHPFFYVSSSEWNLYDYLTTVFEEHQLPKGIFLLNTIKHLSSFVKTGKSGHEGKLMRITRILFAFPQHEFILLGDNTQKDPEIYAAIAERYPIQIAHVLIRNVRKENESATKAFMKNIEYSGVSTCIFNTTQDAISYCRATGLIHDRMPTAVDMVENVIVQS